MQEKIFTYLLAQIRGPEKVCHTFPCWDWPQPLSQLLPDLLPHFILYSVFGPSSLGDLVSLFHGEAPTSMSLLPWWCLFYRIFIAT